MTLLYIQEFFDKVQSWPLDGMVVGGFIAVGILLLVIFRFIETRPVIKQDNKFTLKAGIRSNTFFIGTVMATTAILYTISQSYKGQEIAAFSVGLVFIVATVHLAYIFYMQKCVFGFRTITFTKFLRKSQSLNWDNCVDSEGIDSSAFSLYAGCLALHFKNNKTFYISAHLNGSYQLSNLSCVHLFGLENFKYSLNDNSDFFNRLYNKKILIGITYIDEYLAIDKIMQLSGIITEINDNNLQVNIESDLSVSTLILPLNRNAFDEINEPMDLTLVSTGETIHNPQVLSEWFVMNDDKYNKENK